LSLPCLLVLSADSGLRANSEPAAQSANPPVTLVAPPAEGPTLAGSETGAWGGPGSEMDSRVREELAGLVDAAASEPPKDPDQAPLLLLVLCGLAPLLVFASYALLRKR
jgi:hypothetical protein